MRSFLVLAVWLVLPSLGQAQQPPDFSKVQIKVTQVSGNVYMLEGAGGNIAASLGPD
jgi:cyclase